MRNEAEFFLLKHGPYWIIVLAGVIIQKMFSKDTNTLFKVFRSAFSSLAITSLIVFKLEKTTQPESLYIYVFMVGLCIDVIIPKLIETGPAVLRSIINQLTGNKS